MDDDKNILILCIMARRNIKYWLPDELLNIIRTQCYEMHSIRNYPKNIYDCLYYPYTSINTRYYYYSPTISPRIMSPKLISREFISQNTIHPDMFHCIYREIFS